MAKPGSDIPPVSTRARALPGEDAFVSAMRFVDVVTAELIDVFKQFNLTTQQYNVLRILYVRGEPISTGLIGERLVTRVPDVPRLIDRLSERGLVRRQACADDRRKTLVSLTAKGERLLQELDPVLLEHLARVFAPIPVKDLAALRDLLDRARDAIGRDGRARR